MVAPAIIGVTATLAAFAFWVAGGPSLTALEWALYDRWLQAQPPPAVSPSTLVIMRDPGSEARFGTGTWDRAVLARVIGNVARAGAVAIGIDLRLDQPSAPARGGAASDAILGQATASADAVVYPIALEVGAITRAETADRSAAALSPHPSWAPLPTMEGPARRAERASPRTAEGPPVWLLAQPPTGPLPALAEQAKAVGHTVALPDADDVVRRVPLFVQVGAHLVPAFGVALVATAAGTRPSPFIEVPDRSRHMLVRYRPIGPRVVPFSEVWAAVEGSQPEVLQRLVDSAIVVLMAEPAGPLRMTPLGPMSEVMIQAHLVTTLLAKAWLRETPLPWALLGTLLLAALVAWLCLAARFRAALIGLVALGAGGGASVLLALGLVGVVVPVGLPVVATVLTTVVAVGWRHFASGHRLRHLEDENARVREALVRHESAVEALEEDLESARAAVARSTGAERELGRAADTLRAQLAEARAQEEETRRRLDAVQHELRGLRGVDRRPDELGDVEQERLRRACEQSGILSRDPAVLALFRDLEKAARSSLPILLVGEAGTGKELFARAAHRLSPRAERPFVPVNMAAISPELFESELYGHVRGSFTGAVGDRRGYFELADRGTVFLDEIGDLRLEHQSKLLRVLQEKSFYRVGASRPTAVDVRVVAASNRDLERGVAEGWFREDLYFRLKGVVVRLPPLRERPGDLPLLAGRIVAEAAAEIGRDGLTLSEEALLALGDHTFPGNIRELQQCLRQAVALAEGPVITREDLRLAVPERRLVGAIDVDLEAGSDTAVLACLRQHGFDMQATARDLGWDRSTVTQRLKGMGFRALVEAGGDRAKAALALAGDRSLMRAVEVKLREYHDHLLRAIQGFETSEAAIRACRRRFKNLPERHFRALELLVHKSFEPRKIGERSRPTPS